MKLIKLSDGRSSLEFVTDEWKDVEAKLTRLAGRNRYVVREEATYDMIEIGDVQLILMEEWDEPCLISMSPAGDRLLQRVIDFARKSSDLLVCKTDKRGAALAA